MAKPLNKSVLAEEDARMLLGTEVIKKYQKDLPEQPGVYRMIDNQNQPLYVGKAKNLKRRVASYSTQRIHDARIKKMIAATASMEFITTHTEVEALLLESNLIKKLKPRFNILLRDDKSFPYILITEDHEWPQITKHRGSKRKKGKYFGPFASVGAVNQTINSLQRAFPLRNCSDSTFSSRTRPCLQFQIKRCTAPCVGKIDSKNYGSIVKQAESFLSGKSHSIQKMLSKKMEKASKSLDYESAAIYRDRIRALTRVQANQIINIPNIGDADVIALSNQLNITCVQVFFFRSGQNFGNRPYFPTNTRNFKPKMILEAFLGQFYISHTPPSRIFLSNQIDNLQLIQSALSVRAGNKVELLIPQKGAKKSLVLQAKENAEDAIKRRLAEAASQRELLDRIAEKFGLDAVPERIEVYDNSHISGSNPVGAMIVSGREGILRNQFRKFNIKSKDSSPGDDYAMLREVLTRRFSRLIKESDKLSTMKWPDLVLIDGGAGHLAEAEKVFEEFGITGITIAAIAKGPDRNAGKEKFYLSGKPALQFKEGDPVLFYLQRLRDESHRYVLQSHRKRRSREMKRSALDEVPGIGPFRKRALLNRFGSVQAITEAGIKDLERVEGISQNLAETVYLHFHSDS